MENWLNKYQDGGKVTYGTPEYTDAYNKGEVITKEGIHSPILLDEVTVRGKKKSKNWLEQYADKIVEENKDAGPLGAIIGTPLSAITSLPQMLATKLMSGKMQRPSEAMDIQNPVGAFTMDAIADPLNLIGVGELSGLSKIAKEQALARIELSKESGLLSNAHKINPWAFKPNPEATYRGIGEAGYQDAIKNNVLRPPINSAFGEDLYTSTDFNIAQNYSRGNNPMGYKVIKNSDGTFNVPEINVGDKSYIAEISNKSLKDANRTFDKEVIFDKPIPNDNVKYLKEHWLQGYKEVPKPEYVPPIREQFIQPISKFSQSELSSEMEPWLSKYVKPISGEEEVFRNSMGRDYYNKKLLEDTVNLDKEGNIISNKEGFSLSYKQILNLPEKEILEKTGKSKEDWELFINHKPDRYGKSLEDTFNSAYEPSLKQLQKVNKGKQQLTDFYNSSEYRNRLQNATGLDFDSAINKQTDLINSVNKTKPRYVQSTGYKSLESDAKAYTSGADSEGTKLGIDFSERGLNRPDAEYLASHEFGHTSLYDIKNHELLNKLPKLDLDSETLSNWKKWGDESKDTSYHDMIDYYSNPDEARQRGINAILYSKNKGISTDELVDIPYNDIITKNRSGDIPNDIMELRQLYDQKQLKGYLKNLFTITGVGTIGALQLKQNKNGGWLSKYN